MSSNFKVITDLSNNYFKNNKIVIGNTIPSSGTYVIGDIVISGVQNDNVMGWLCVKTGEPGEWKNIELVDLDILNTTIAALENVLTGLQIKLNNIDSRTTELEGKIIEIENMKQGFVDALSKHNIEADSTMSWEELFDNLISNAVTSNDVLLSYGDDLENIDNVNIISGIYDSTNGMIYTETVSDEEN